MIINTLVSYKYEISERMILGNMMRGFDSVPIEVAAGVSEWDTSCFKRFCTIHRDQYLIYYHHIICQKR